MTARDRDRFHSAFVLHARPFRNSSQIVEVLTEKMGRVGLVARGSTRGKSPQSALLQPFTPLQLTWSGRGELHTLNRLEATDRAFTLPGRRMLCGLYANELLVRMLHRGDPHPELFHGYCKLLSGLSRGESEARILRGFEILLLEAVGFGFDLHLDCSGSPIHPEQHYGYHPEEGLTPVPHTMAAEGGHSLLVTGKTLQWLRATERAVENRVMQEAKQLLRTAIDYHLPGELESRKLIAQYGALN